MHDKCNSMKLSLYIEREKEREKGREKAIEKKRGGERKGERKVVRTKKHVMFNDTFRSLRLTPYY